MLRSSFWPLQTWPSKLIPEFYFEDLIFVSFQANPPFQLDSKSEVRLSRTSERLEALKLSTDQEALTAKTVMRSLEERLGHAERTRMAAEQREHR